MTHSFSAQPLTSQARAKMRFPMIIVLLAVSFVLGFLAGSRPPSWLQSVLWCQGDGTDTPPGVNVSARPVDALGAEEDNSAARLLEELAVRLNHLERREAELRRERREAEVALRLLHGKGELANAPVCREQEAKVHVATIALTRLREEKIQALRWRSELHQAQREDRPTGEAAALNSELEKRVRIYLTRRSLLRETLLPDAEPGTANPINAPAR